jgi:hypothetical protein
MRMEHNRAGADHVAGAFLKTNSARGNHGAVFSTVLGAALVLLAASPLSADKDDRFLPSPSITVSTVPSNGDVNPSGVAFVPKNFAAGGTINPGDILVSNFNNKKNLQGTGTTIIRIQPNGGTSLFFQGTAPLGLSTALGTLRAGFVVVGNLPTSDGNCATAQSGSLLILNSSGSMIGTITDPLINGPWDMTIQDNGNSAKIFVANALSGAITRIDLQVKTGNSKMTQIASGYMHRCDPVALVVGPTGLVYDATNDVLFVASTEDNKVFAVHDAGNTSHDHGTGVVIYNDQVHLHGPLGMAMAPNGHLLVANADVINSDPNQPSEIVEFTTAGKFIGQLSVDPAQGGSFGLAVARMNEDFVRFAAVDDNASNITIWTLPSEP